MSDYTPTTDFSPKDALPTNDPNKLVLGAELDTEFDAIQTAIATKYDVTDIATQAQAEAGVSNSVLITPLRLSQYLGTGNGAGIVNDLVGLADPNADRILFWDDSAGSAAFLTAGSGLTITGTTLTVDSSVLDHDALTGFVANEHIDHTSVTITAGAGLSYSSGGTDISASATIDLDINELTGETTVDPTNDYLAMYDASATAVRKVTVENIAGDLVGDGKWYRNSTQAISAATETTVVFNAAEYDELQRGTFSTVTGQYTAGASACRIFIHAMIRFDAADDDEALRVIIEVNGTEKAYTYFYNDTDNDTPIQTIQCSTNLSLAASDVVQVRVLTGGSENIVAGVQNTQVNIIELG